MVKKSIGIGDIVQIIDPQFFLRTKYEKDFQFFYDKVILEQEQMTNQMLEVKCPHWKFTSDIRAAYLLRDHIIRGLACYELELSKQTGNVKHLETMPIMWYKDKKFLVYNVSHVATGIYQAGSSGQYSSTGEYWSEPPGLVNRKYHQILHVIPFDNGIYNEYDKLKIETVNVKFVEKKTVDTPIPTQLYYNPVFDDDSTQEYIQEMYLQQPVKPYYKEP